MLTTLILWSSLAAVSQAGERTEWPLAPRLARGQELIYRGTATEQSLSRGVQFSKTYRLEARGLVLDVKGDAVDMAFLTRLAQQHTSNDKSDSGETASLRLEVAEVDATGRLASQRGLLATTSLDGPSTWEAGYFIELPKAGVTIGQSWQVEQPGRPPLTVRVAAAEPLGNVTCVKLVVEQQSEEWAKPRGDTAAWRRRDTLWILPRLGVAQRVARELERRDPAHKEPSYRLVTQYDLESSLRYEGLFLEDRRREILTIRQFEDSVKSLLPKQPQNTAAFRQIIARIDQFTEKYPATPYRDALLRTRKLALDASENKLPPQVTEAAKAERLAVGKAAPDFLVEDLRTKESVSLRKWKGKAVLMVFFLPGSESARLFMRHIQNLADQHSDQNLVVLGFAMSDDAEKTADTVERMRLTFPTLAGRALRLSYDVDATPRFVVVDSEGVVQGAYTGWGPEIAPALGADLKKCLPTITAEGRP
jgi:peroxiredoxin